MVFAEVAPALPMLVRLSIFGSRGPGTTLALGWDALELEKLSTYLQAAEIVRPGPQDRCPFCQQHVSLALVSDGFFLWPLGLAHMVEAHGVRPHLALVWRALGLVT